jgi:hypothetical protein
MDDASQDLWARLVVEDTEPEHLQVFRRYREQNGRPWACSVDPASLYRVNPRRTGYGDERREVGESQMGRALRELGMEWIHAPWPPAKGRVERCRGTLQDRLEKGLRKAGAKTMEAAHRYLKQVFQPD